jgi:hypothetical protein
LEAAPGFEPGNSGFAVLRPKAKPLNLLESPGLQMRSIYHNPHPIRNHFPQFAKANQFE